MTYLTTEDLKNYQALLLDLKKTLMKEDDALTDASAVVELDQTRVGRLSRMDALQGQAMSKAVQARRQQQLKEVNLALKRIDSNDFGFCQNCDEQIARQRLDINPAVRLCIKCAD